MCCCFSLLILMLYCVVQLMQFSSTERNQKSWSHHSAGYRRVSEFEGLGPNSALIFLTVLAEKEMNIIQ